MWTASFAVVDCGQVVNPNTVEAQMQSGMIFGISAALWGEVTLKDGRVEQSNFDNYRVLRIEEAPQITVEIVKSSEAPGGIGEPGTSALMPAVTNAVFAATGVRLQEASDPGAAVALDLSLVVPLSTKLRRIRKPC